MATQDKVGKRYAKAIFESQKDKAALEKVRQELAQFQSCLAESKELSLVLASNIFRKLSGMKFWKTF